MVVTPHGFKPTAVSSATLTTQTQPACTAIHVCHKCLISWRHVRAQLVSWRHPRPVYTHPFHPVPAFRFPCCCIVYILPLSSFSLSTKGSRRYQTWSSGATRRGSIHSLPRLPCRKTSTTMSVLRRQIVPKCRLGFVLGSTSIEAYFLGVARSWGWGWRRAVGCKRVGSS